MRLESSVKNKYPTSTIGYAVVRNVKIERIVSELEKEKDKYKKLNQLLETLAHGGVQIYER